MNTPGTQLIKRRFLMAKILIIYYSRTGNTEKMAQEVQEGVREEGVEVVTKKVGDTVPEELMGYDGIIVGSPCYFGTMAGEIKMFFDKSVSHFGKLEGKVGAAFSSSGILGGGNETTVLDIIKALLVHGMIIQGDTKTGHYGPVAIGAPDKQAQKECSRLGRRVAQLVKAIIPPESR
jgi:NAD(P)H dehydrogenase (quinone)